MASSVGIGKGNFIGFTIGGIHSSVLNVVRVSNGSRYNEELTATFEDHTTSIPGSHGDYYFGTLFKSKPLILDIAFDSLTDAQMVKLRQAFDPLKLHNFIFDEKPYKVYTVKLTGPISLSYIAFTDAAGHRIYKGEGSISLLALQPFARSRYKFIEDYKDTNIPEWGYLGENNLSEWESASGIISSKIEGSIYYDKLNEDTFYLYNPGDVETNFTLDIKFNESGVIPTGLIRLKQNTNPNAEGGVVGELQWNLITRINSDEIGVRIDSKLNIIQGLKGIWSNNEKTVTTTGTVYNKSISEGFFFKIPTNIEDKILTLLVGTDIKTLCDEEIVYDYLYY